MISPILALVRDRCGFNTAKKLKTGASFFAHQTYLYRVKESEADGFRKRLEENLRSEGWAVLDSHSVIKPHASFSRWSVINVRVRAAPPKNYKPACGICGRVHALSRRC
jgi:hypothetical protein